MKKSMFAATAVFAVVVAAASAQEPVALSRQEFKQTLQRTADSISQSKPSGPALDLGSLPAVWIVRDGGTEFRVSTMWLRNGVAAMNLHPADRVALQTALLQRIKALEAECDAAPAQANASVERNRLQGILERREFRQVHGPTWLDELRLRILRILTEWLGRLFGMEAAPELGKIFVWLVILAAVGVLGWWARRLLVRSADVPSIATGIASLPP